MRQVVNLDKNSIKTPKTGTQGIYKGNLKKGPKTPKNDQK